MEQVKRIYYVDGSGNRYNLRLEEGKPVVKYEPVTPEMSSSGFYSGGEPFERNIDTKLFNQIAETATQAIKTKTDHINERIMGSGLLTIEINNSKQKAILTPNSKIKQKLEKLLKKTKPKNSPNPNTDQTL
ncbi:MAG: hypothetical protein QW279_13550 [Candidatus Jordarchaeaceae archaeon]